MRIPLGILLACGALAGWLLAGVVPSGLLEQCRRDVVTQPFHLSRVVEVTESSWFFLPQLWGDFDLNMDLELSAGAEVDVLLRQVEPRFVDEVQLPFTGRFAALRITADDPGREPADEQQAERGWRTREQALFGSRGDGVRLAPGRPATIWIEGRGATLTANVGGKRQEPFEADDVYGMLAVLVRDGKAVIHRLDMLTQPIAGEWRWRPLTWAGFGLLAALLVAAFASLLSRRRQFAAAGGTLLGLTWVLGRGVELDLMFPDPLGMAVLLAVPAVFATLVAVQRGRVLLAAVTAVAVVVAGGALWPDALAAPVRAALGGDDASAVEEVFGPDAGEQPSKALAQLVRMPNGLIDREKRGARAFLLGGEWLYNRGEPGEHTGLQLGALLRGAFGPGADAPSLPTTDGYSSQQWRVFDGFYQGFEPDVLVFGVGADEQAVDPVTGEPRSSPRRLRETLLAVREDCRARGRKLVLFADVGVPTSLLNVLREFEAGGAPLVVLTDEVPRPEVARRLFERIRPLLER